MNHAITVLDVLKFGGIALAICCVLGIVFYVLAAFGRGMSQ